MNKKLLWLAALLAALALFVTGCPGGEKEDDDDKDKDKGGSGEFKWYLTDTEGGEAVPGNQITITKNCDVYVYFDAPGATFDKLKITYTVDPGQNLTYACLYDKFGEGDDEEIHTWGITSWTTIWRGGTEDVIAELDPSAYGDKWSKGTQDGRSGIDRTKIFGLCINFNDITTGVNPVFTLKNVELTGKGTPVTPPPTPIDVTLATEFSDTKATIDFSNLVTLVDDGNDKAIKILPTTTNENKNNFKISIMFSPPVDIDSVSSLAFEWKSTPTATSLKIGAGIETTGGYTWMINESSGISNPGSLSFTSDVPSWAADWGNKTPSGTCSKIDIEFTDGEATGYTELYIKKIGFSNN